MKRNKNLVTLSWEHHNGLVSVSRLKRGLSNGTSENELVSYLTYIWSEDLVHHFDQEETILIPPAERLTDSHKLLEEFFDHHRRLKSLAESIKRLHINRKDYIHEFTNLLEKHIRFEEKQFFPFIENQLNEDQLQTIGEYLKSQHRPGCKTWQHEFWKNPSVNHNDD